MEYEAAALLVRDAEKEVKAILEAVEIRLGKEMKSVFFEKTQEAFGMRVRIEINI